MARGLQQARHQGDGPRAFPDSIDSNIQSLVDRITHRLHTDASKHADAERLPLERVGIGWRMWQGTFLCCGWPTGSVRVSKERCLPEYSPCIFSQENQAVREEADDDWNQQVEVEHVPICDWMARESDELKSRQKKTLTICQSCIIHAATRRRRRHARLTVRIMRISAKGHPVICCAVLSGCGMAREQPFVLGGGHAAVVDGTGCANGRSEAGVGGGHGGGEVREAGRGEHGDDTGYIHHDESLIPVSRRLLPPGLHLHAFMHSFIHSFICRLVSPSTSR